MENGTRVARRVTRQDARDQTSPRVGKVIATTEADMVVVEWDKDWRGKPSVDKVQVKDLMLESEIDSEISRLNKEFVALEEQVRKQVQMAADALREAGKLANAGGEELCGMHEAIYPLLDAMDDAGWQTSSLHC